MKISRFYTKFEETFSEAWEVRFKEFLDHVPITGFTEMNATSSKMDERIDKLADQLSTLVEIVSKKVVIRFQGYFPSNTIPNPKGEMKAITTRSGAAYEGPSIPTNPSPKKTLSKTTPIPESDIPKSLPKPNILCTSRRDDQKSRDKASNQMEKIFQIFQVLRFDISFGGCFF
ncbi:hypothetical protein Tco_1016540 [Tanacetum coccineum]|uniref:Uncharacterized protein n=1 Tax=Tanacetum coccineum TaxID=301880 RepID=A0ABQ5FNW8_9ASTR